MNFALFLSTQRSAWHWKPKTYYVNRILLDGKRNINLNVQWLFFGFQIDNDW